MFMQLCMTVIIDKQHMNATLYTAVQQASTELATPGSDPTMLLAQFMPVQ